MSAKPLQESGANTPPTAAPDLLDELHAVRDAVEKLYLLLDPIWRNRDELRDVLESLIEDATIKGPGEFPLEEALEMGLTLGQIRQAFSEGITSIAGLRRIEKSGRTDAEVSCSTEADASGRAAQTINRELFEALRFLVQEIKQPPLADSYVADAVTRASAVLEKCGAAGLAEADDTPGERIPDSIACTRAPAPEPEPPPPDAEDQKRLFRYCTLGD